MVLEDIFVPEKANPKNAAEAARWSSLKSRKLEQVLAAPVDRLAAQIADLVLFLPVLTLVLAPFSRRAKEAQILGSDEAWGAAVFAAFGAGFLTLLFYQTFFVCWFGATPGKLALRLRVISIWRPFDERPKPLEAFLRSLVFCGELVLGGIPWLAIFANEKRRPFHDRISDTAVIALSSRRQAGPPTLAEMSVASGFQSSGLAALTLLAVINFTEYRKHKFSTADIASAREDEGKLCPEVREAIEETPGRKAGSIHDRLQTALSLYSINALETDCLNAEAEFALWQNEEQSLAYLAKGLAADEDKQADSYFEKACERSGSTSEPEKGEVCAMVELARADAETDDEIAVDKEASVERDGRIEKIVSSVTRDNSAYLRVQAVQYLMTAHDYTRALELMDRGAESRRVSAYLAKERAEALWSLDRKPEARLAMSATADLVDASTRVELARWFCFNDTVNEGCTNEAKRSCSVLSDSVARFDGWLMKPEITTAYIRSQTCAKPANVDWAELENKIPSADGKSLVKALSKIESGARAEGVAELQSFVTNGFDKQNAFSLEANARLIDLAANADDLKPIETWWRQLDTKEEGWKPLGEALLRRLTSFKAWDRTLNLGLKMIKSDPTDRAAYESMVIAANNSGQKKMAMGFLEAALRLRKVPSEQQRAPASQPTFEETARELLKSSREGRK